MTACAAPLMPLQFDLFSPSARHGLHATLHRHLLRHEAHAATQVWCRLLGESLDSGYINDVTDLLRATRLARDETHDVDEALARLDSHVPHAAARVLGRADGARFVADTWEHLAARLAGIRFDARHPLRHVSLALLRCQRWQEAIACIEATPGYQAEPVLIERLAEAYAGAGRHERALLTAARLAVLDESYAAGYYRRHVPGTRLRTLWTAFGDARAEFCPSLFPAFVVIAEPGLRHHLTERDFADDRSGALQAACALLARRDTGECQRDTRQSLMEISPGLLEVYTERFASVRLRSVPSRKAKA